MHPDLRHRARERAQALGLSFSRYATLCMEAELNGQVARLINEHPAAPPATACEPDHAWSRPARRTTDEDVATDGDNGFANTFADDVEKTLRALGMQFERDAAVAHLSTDFLLEVWSTDRAPPFRVCLECRHDMRARYTVTLGQAVILRSLTLVDAVILVVPYRSTFDKTIADAFAQQDIAIATPDDLEATIKRTAQGLTTQPAQP